MSLSDIKTSIACISSPSVITEETKSLNFANAKFANAKLSYIHRNPVTRGLVRPEDWKWSSFLQWTERFEGPVEIECPATVRKRERTKLRTNR